jgi:hypothetical protein
VPVIAADPMRSRRESLVRTLGSTLRATTPGTVDPPPVFSLRLANLADPAASIAAERRGSSGLMAWIISSVEHCFVHGAKGLELQNRQAL